MITKNKLTTKRFAPKLNIKKGDQVIVISGDQKGKKGEVQKVMKESLKAIVADINLVKRHTKPTNNNPGGIKEIPAPIYISKLQLVDPKSGEPTRVGRKMENGKSVRYSKKSGQTIK
ncbi:MAG: 50S ribosomal protein L24 [Saprospiraceae bacterium]